MSSVSGTSPDINGSWVKYDYKVKHELRAIRNGMKRKDAFTLIVNRGMELRTILDNLENTTEFDAFVEDVRSVVTTAGYHKGNTSFWENAIRNALRLSGYYSGIATGRRVNSKAALRRLLRAFEPHDVTITYLAPMEYVSLTKSRIDCGSFTITKFTTKDLDKILKSKACKQFYPSAFDNTAVGNTGFLSSYWFLVVRKKRKLKPLGRIEGDFGSIGKVTPKYSPYPALDKAFQRLAMYDWLPDYRTDKDTSHKRGTKSNDWAGWMGFRIPFVIRLTDSILDRPASSPNLETLQTEPYFDQTGEEIGEQPIRCITLDEEQTRTLEQCLKRVDAMFNNIEPLPASWSFLKTGLGFLVKGFFTRELEQLLWHIIALEALFGEDRPGLTQLMARRVASVLGETEAQKKDISERFDELYKLRSKLVHGTEIKGEVWQGQLKVARDLARRSLLWFLSFLGEFSKGGKRSLSAIPVERKEILAVIDSRAWAIIELAKILKSAPPAFPAVKAWQEPWALHR